MTTQREDIKGELLGFRNSYPKIPSSNPYADVLNAVTKISADNSLQHQQDILSMSVAATVDSPTPIVFQYIGGFAAGQTDIEIYESTGIFQRILVKGDFSLVGSVVQSTSPRIAGTLIIAPTIDGVKVSNNNLNLVLDGTNPLQDSKKQPLGEIGLIGTDAKIGLKLTSDIVWDNSNGSLYFILYVVFAH